MDERDLLEVMNNRCATCGHHRDAHERETDTLGQPIYYGCAIHGCSCKCYVPLESPDKSTKRKK